MSWNCLRREKRLKFGKTDVMEDLEEMKREEEEVLEEE